MRGRECSPHGVANPVERGWCDRRARRSSHPQSGTRGPIELRGAPDGEQGEPPQLSSLRAGHPDTCPLQHSSSGLRQDARRVGPCHVRPQLLLPLLLCSRPRHQPQPTQDPKKRRTSCSRISTPRSDGASRLRVRNCRSSSVETNGMRSSATSTLQASWGARLLGTRSTAQRAWTVGPVAARSQMDMTASYPTFRKSSDGESAARIRSPRRRVHLPRPTLAPALILDTAGCSE